MRVTSTSGADHKGFVYVGSQSFQAHAGMQSPISLEDIKILTTEKSDVDLLIKDSLTMKLSNHLV